VIGDWWNTQEYVGTREGRGHVLTSAKVSPIERPVSNVRISGFIIITTIETRHRGQLSPKILAAHKRWSPQSFSVRPPPDTLSLVYSNLADHRIVRGSRE